VKAIADTLGVARSNLIERRAKPAQPRGPYRKQEDAALLPIIRQIVDERPSYGYRRITALLNRALRAKGEPAVNAKRVLRIMRLNGLTLAPHTALPPGRTHDGVVVALRSERALVLRPPRTARPGWGRGARAVRHRRLRPRGDRLVGHDGRRVG
jgi:hypothetical protein